MMNIYIGLDIACVATIEQKNKYIVYLYTSEGGICMFQHKAGGFFEFEDKFPVELLERGHDWSDLNDWILSIETEYSKNEKRLVIA